MNQQDVNTDKTNELGSFLKLMRGKSFEAIFNPEEYVNQLEASLAKKTIEPKHGKKLAN